MAKTSENPASSQLEGSQRAAILLMTLGEQTAAEILKHMGPREVQKIGSAMSTLSGVTKSTVRQVVEEFLNVLEEQTVLGIGNDEYLRSVLVKALGEDKAGSILDRISSGQGTHGLDQLKWMDARSIAEIVRLEHPQIIALVLSYLDPDQAAEVLTNLPENIRSDIVLRISMLDTVQPQAIKELDQVLERQFTGNTGAKSSSVGGLKTAAEILNYMDSGIETTIMENLTQVDPDTAQSIEDLMFVFDNLAELDDRSMQALLREVNSETLVTALKGASEPLREKVFKNISKRAAEMLRDDLETKGPVRVSEVEVAQKEILSIARRMSDTGELVLGGRGGDDFV